MEKMKFNHFPIISLWELYGNQTKKQTTIILAIFKSPTQATFLPN